MLTSQEIFVKLYHTEGIWAKTLFGFLPDPRMTCPQRLLSPSIEEIQNEQVLYDVCYFNGY